ncbi:hypothetical protein PAESOLCIP111_00021 [Paenibacillus solanacearum]|uniref:Uncharacterized protein n=1 Tax=Paenibacillus solanacearum TaxID=2048548 RepID=A0A916JR12_9BACL|nr:hypothetical protein PAESOLCIP111_00021 [Paenibacillus solanacearum]
MHMSPTGAIFGILPLILFFVYIGLAGLGVYCLILFIQLARRAIRALDIYISEKTDRRDH